MRKLPEFEGYNLNPYVSDKFKQWVPTFGTVQKIRPIDYENMPKQPNKHTVEFTNKMYEKKLVAGSNFPSYLRP